MQAGTSSCAVQSHRMIPASSDDSLPLRNATFAGNVIVEFFTLTTGASFLPRMS